MMQSKTWAGIGSIILALGLNATACKDKENVPGPKDLPDLTQRTFSYTTVENTRVRTGPGTEFRSIAEIGANSKVNVVGRDGDWVLIVSKKGNAPGFIELAAVKAVDASAKQTLNPHAEGKYEAAAEVNVRSGPGLHYPVLAKISKGTKLNVVEEENGWLKVESKRGNEPGYVEASFTKSASD
jgi:N-acetylmuramoyl-L-alanine amidase